MLTEKQKEARKSGIGASECAAVMGASRWMSPYKLWMIKTGRYTEEEQQTPAQVWGSIHEESIANYFAQATGHKVRRVSETLRHKEYPFILCHIDRKIEGLPKLLECKFAIFNREEMWGESGTDDVPLYYIIQVQHQLAVTGYQEAYLAVLIGGWDFRIYHIKRDEAVISELIKRLKHFWECVVTNKPVDLRDRADAALCFPVNNHTFKTADADIFATAMQLKVIKAKIKDLELEKNILEDKITLAIQDSDGLIFQDQVLATWKLRKGGGRVLRVA